MVQLNMKQYCMFFEKVDMRWEDSRVSQAVRQRIDGPLPAVSGEED